MSIAWDAFWTVVLVAVLGTSLLVSLYALGVRFYTDAENLAPAAAKGDAVAIRKESLFRSVSYIFFTVCALAVLYGVYLIIPAFHK